MANDKTYLKAGLFILTVGCMSSGIALMLYGFSYWVGFLGAAGAIGHAILFSSTNLQAGNPERAWRARLSHLTGLLSLDVGALVATLLGFDFYVSPTVYLTLLILEAVSAAVLLGASVYTFLRFSRFEAEKPDVSPQVDAGLIRVSGTSQPRDMQPLNVQNAVTFLNSHPGTQIDSNQRLIVKDQPNQDTLLTNCTVDFFSDDIWTHAYNLTLAQQAIFKAAQKQIVQQKRANEMQQVFGRLKAFDISLDQVLIINQWSGATFRILGVNRHNLKLSDLDLSVPHTSLYFMSISLQPSVMGLPEQDLVISTSSGTEQDENISEREIAPYFSPRRTVALQLQEAVVQLQKAPEAKEAKKDIFFESIVGVKGRVVIEQGAQEETLQVTIAQVPGQLLSGVSNGGTVNLARYKSFSHLARNYKLDITDDGGPLAATVKFTLPKMAAFAEAAISCGVLAKLCKENEASLQYTSATQSYSATCKESWQLRMFFSWLINTNIITSGGEVVSYSSDITLNFKPNPLFAELLYEAFQKKGLVPPQELPAKSSRVSLSTSTVTGISASLQPASGPFPSASPS